MIPKKVIAWFEENQLGRVVSQKPASGGCINNGMILKLDSSESFFLKINSSAPADMFLREVEGLDALRSANGPIVPKSFIHGPGFLLQEDLSPTGRCANYWELFGQNLAALHQKTAAQFGFPHANYIGSTPQPNTWADDGFVFFAEYRLRYMAKLTRDQGLLDQSEYRDVENLAGRLVELIPAQPPSLIHGDLWSGNAIADSQGRPAIIDPAVYYGWAEAELAMTTLFGTFPRAFYEAYENVRQLEPGYPSRFPIYNLYHLLNHLYIFGRGYLGQVKAILRRYS